MVKLISLLTVGALLDATRAVDIDAMRRDLVAAVDAGALEATCGVRPAAGAPAFPPARPRRPGAFAAADVDGRRWHGRGPLRDGRAGPGRDARGRRAEGHRLPRRRPLRATLELDGRDSGLTLSNYENEAAWLSGGVPLATTWARAANATYETRIDETFPYRGTILGLNVVEPHRRFVRARYPNGGGSVGVETRSGVGQVKSSDILSYGAPPVVPPAAQVYAADLAYAAHRGALQRRRARLAGRRKKGIIDPLPPFYVENVREELDEADEWHFDNDTKILSYAHNGTGPPPADWQFVAPDLATLISVVGTKEEPVEDVTIRGLGFRDASITRRSTTISSSVFFNGPRSAINFNDGFGGGNVVDRNAIWNVCRQSGDHGPINSWDRQAYDAAPRPAAAGPLPTVISRNAIIANYGGSQGVDNDDGSSWYDIFDNFFSARASRTTTGPRLGAPRQHGEDARQPLHDHRPAFLAPDKTELASLAFLQSGGVELGSTEGTIPDDATIVAWGRAALGF
ncbi:hypothetical protein JL721_5975 [Aureococcus anophagefferens]|nr:hypothetical protein JL721_5975 [Aureococcus anophagefferens]